MNQYFIVGVIHITGNKYLNPFYEQVIGENNITFGNVQNQLGENEELKLDVYSPDTDSEELRPVILWIHGGGFRHGTKEQGYIVNLCNRYAKKGFVCVANNYRLRTNPLEDFYGTLKDAVDDTILALDWIRNNHAQHMIDKNRIIIAGGSAGGKIATQLCYGNYEDLQGIKGSIILWGAPGEKQISITEDSIPAIVVHGTVDEAVPFENSESLVHDLKSNGVYHKFLPLEGAPHTPIMHIDHIDKEISDFLNSIL